MKRTHWTLAALLAALASGSTAAHAAAAPANGGSFRMDKNKTTFSAGCGFRVPAPEDGVGKVKRVVVLASLKMDCAAADQGFDPVATLETTLRDASADPTSMRRRQHVNISLDHATFSTLCRGGLFCMNFSPGWLCFLSKILKE